MSEINENTQENSQESIDDGIPSVSFTLEVHDTQQAPVDETLSVRGMAADAYETGVAIQTAKSELQAQITALGGDIENLIGLLFPVGCIYTTTSDTAPTFGGENWNWQEVKIPVTQGDLIDGFRGYADFEEGDDPGENHLHFWMRIEDTEAAET